MSFNYQHFLHTFFIINSVRNVKVIIIINCLQLFLSIKSLILTWVLPIKDYFYIALKTKVIYVSQSIICDITKKKNHQTYTHLQHSKTISSNSKRSGINWWASEDDEESLSNTWSLTSAASQDITSNKDGKPLAVSQINTNTYTYSYY